MHVYLGCVLQSSVSQLHTSQNTVRKGPHNKYFCATWACDLLEKPSGCELAGACVVECCPCKRALVGDRLGDSSWWLDTMPGTLLCREKLWLRELSPAAPPAALSRLCMSAPSPEPTAWLLKTCKASPRQSSILFCCEIVPYRAQHRCAHHYKVHSEEKKILQTKKDVMYTLQTHALLFKEYQCLQSSLKAGRWRRLSWSSGPLGSRDCREKGGIFPGMYLVATFLEYSLTLQRKEDSIFFLFSYDLDPMLDRRNHVLKTQGFRNPFWACLQ